MVSGCVDPEARLAAWCAAAKNRGEACQCFEEALSERLDDAEIRALADGELGPDGLPLGFGPEAAAALAEAKAVCQVRFGGAISGAK